MNINSTKKTTKEEARRLTAEWRLAGLEGRRVRFDDGMSATAYRTVEDAQEAVRVAIADGRQANIIDPKDVR